MKLTPEEKETNRLARNARDRAWNARYKAREAAEKAKTAVIDATLRPLYNTASIAQDKVLKERSIALQAVDDKIAELQASKETIKASFEEPCNAARSITAAAWNKVREAQKAMEQELDTEFPDLTGHARWSSATWKPIGDFK